MTRARNGVAPPCRAGEHVPGLMYVDPNDGRGRARCSVCTSHYDVAPIPLGASDASGESPPPSPASPGVAPAGHHGAPTGVGRTAHATLTAAQAHVAWQAGGFPSIGVWPDLDSYYLTNRPFTEDEAQRFRRALPGAVLLRSGEGYWVESVQELAAPFGVQNEWQLLALLAMLMTVAERSYQEGSATALKATLGGGSLKVVKEITAPELREFAWCVAADVLDDAQRGRTC